MNMVYLMYDLGDLHYAYYVQLCKHHLEDRKAHELIIYFLTRLKCILPLFEQVFRRESSSFLFLEQSKEKEGKWIRKKTWTTFVWNSLLLFFLQHDIAE